MNRIILIYLAIINLIGYFIMLVDKRKAQKKEWRISENTLIMTSVIGGSIGMLLGMQSFHHKTKHKKFTIGIPLILIVQIISAIIIITSIK